MKWLKFLSKQVSEVRPDYPRNFYGTSGGTFITPDTSMKVAAFNRGVIYIATQIAKLPWEIKDAENKILYRDPVAPILKTAVNEEMSSFQFRLVMIITALLKGNAYAEIERDMMGRVRNLWFLDSERVTPDRDINGKLIYRVSNGEFGGNRQEVILYPRNIFHIRNFHTTDGITGQGIIAYAMDTLGISAGADQFANSLYANGAIPSGTLTVQGSLSDEAFARLKDQWEENHSRKKVGGTALLEEGTVYNPITMQPEALQFLESRKFSVIEIARFLGLPPSKLFDTDVATYANIEQSNLEVATDTLDSWARNFETEADMKLLNYGYGGKHSEMDLYAVFRGDMTTRATYFTKMMQAAAITPNEIRKKEGAEPYEGGDRYYIASNNLSPSDRIDELIDAKVNPPNKEPTKPEEDPQDKVSEALARFLESRSRG